jgi:hypothetical protein
MSSSAWSESETNRNSVCSVLSVCKQIRVDSRDTLEIINQRDFTDETDFLRISHLTGTDVRSVRPSLIGNSLAEVRLIKDAPYVRTC